MLKNELLTSAAMLLLLCSCKDDNKLNPVQIPPKEYADFSQLKAGNYWVYQVFKIDSSGNSSPTIVFDSCYVDRDSTIRGNKYFHYHFENNYTQSYDTWLRDSLHYTINSNGAILFSSEDFTTVFDEQYQRNGTDTLAHVTCKMADKDVSVNAPAGSFVTSDYRLTYDMYPAYRNGGAKRILHNRYAKGVGLVTATSAFYPTQTLYMEKRLLRYHLE